MKSSTLSLFLLTPIIGVSGCNPAAEPAQSASSAAGDCFSSSLVNDYETVDDHTIRVRAGVSDFYDVKFSGGQCDRLDRSLKLALETPGISQICVGKTLGQGTLAFRDTISNRRVECHIDEVSLSPPKAK